MAAENEELNESDASSPQERQVLKTSMMKETATAAMDPNESHRTPLPNANTSLRVESNSDNVTSGASTSASSTDKITENDAICMTRQCCEDHENSLVASALPDPDAFCKWRKYPRIIRTHPDTVEEDTDDELEEPDSTGSRERNKHTKPGDMALRYFNGCRRH